MRAPRTLHCICRPTRTGRSKHWEVCMDGRGAFAIVVNPCAKHRREERPTCGNCDYRGSTGCIRPLSERAWGRSRPATPIPGDHTAPCNALYSMPLSSFRGSDVPFHGVVAMFRVSANSACSVSRRSTITTCESSVRRAFVATLCQCLHLVEPPLILHSFPGNHCTRPTSYQ